MSHLIQGSCLCQSVRIELTTAPENFTVCHCESCRRWAGIPMSINGGEHLQFKGEDFVGRYSSSEWAERGFCKNCGTSLFFRLKKSDHYFLYLGLFGDQIAPKFEMQEFIDCKPPSYSFANETKTMTKDQSFALLKNYLNRPSS